MQTPSTDDGSILGKLLMQMTGKDLLLLMGELRESQTQPSQPVRFAYGIQELASELGCCSTTVYYLMKKGTIKQAVISHVGKKYVFDVEMARRLIAEDGMASRSQATCDGDGAQPGS